MTIHVNDSSTWRTVTGLHVNDSSTWREIVLAYVNDGGTWRVTHDVVALSNVSASNSVFSPANASASIRVANNGTVSKEEGSGAGFVTQYSWDLSAGSFSRANYEVRLSGAIFVGGASLNTWLALDTSRTWTLTRSSLGSISDSGTAEIRDAATGNVLASATFSFSASKTSP